MERAVRGYRYQIMAMIGWTSLTWLWRMPHETLIMAGSDDSIVPLVNARVQTWLIRNARLHVVDDGHLFLLTRVKTVGPPILKFLTASSTELSATRVLAGSSN